MPRHTILSSPTGMAGRAKSYPADPIRHDVVFPGLASAREVGRHSLGEEVRDTEKRLDHLREEKRNLERKQAELLELKERQERYRKRRDELAVRVKSALLELQGAGTFELNRAVAFDRSRKVVLGLCGALDTLKGGSELSDPREEPVLTEARRGLREVERELDLEVQQIDRMEACQPETALFASLRPERRGFLTWFRYGLNMFLPLLVVGLLGVIILVAFVGLR
ncbi:MAG: hypothetical protein KGS60_02905 [Verrucomicrobia bacterium]|nr:hypothetical protein [Verrucomicrobiota bacterium]